MHRFVQQLTQYGALNFCIHVHMTIHLYSTVLAYLASDILPSLPMVLLLINFASCSIGPPPGKSFLVGDVVIGLRLAALAAIMAARSEGPPPKTGPPDLLEKQVNFIRAINSQSQGVSSLYTTPKLSFCQVLRD